MSEEESIAQFVSVTQASVSQAKFFLQAANWNMDMAVGEFFTNNGEQTQASNDQDDPDYEDEEGDDADDDDNYGGGDEYMGSTSSSPQPRSSAPQTRQTGLRTFADFLKGQSSTEKDDDDSNDFFAGGSKSSGQMISGGPGKAADDIIKLAKAKTKQFKNEIEEEESKKKKSAFKGKGYTLGDETEESREIAGEEEEEPEQEWATITFWRGGFQVNDGDFRSNDDPANAQFLNEIKDGRAPLELRSTATGNVNINIVNKIQEEFVAPKKKYNPFQGAGNRLGSPTPGVISNAPKPSTSITESTSHPELEIDSSKPVTSIQVRLSDGTKLVVKVNHDHTVAQLHDFVRLARPNTPCFKLMTAYPPKEIKEMKQTIKEAGLVSSVVIQKTA